MKLHPFALIGVLALAACEPAPPPEPEPASKDEATVCLQRRDLPCAEANLRGYIKQYPNDSESTALLAITLTREGKHRESLPFYARAVAAGQVTYDLFAFYAKSLDATGNLDAAIMYNSKALQIVPGLVDVRGDLARQLVRKGKPDEAIALLKWFDAYLKQRGQGPYFTAQIAAIREGQKAAPDANLKPAASAAP
jgi:tetratricopeptide (TPR) repeat protein